MPRVVNGYPSLLFKVFDQPDKRNQYPGGFQYDEGPVSDQPGSITGQARTKNIQAENNLLFPLSHPDTLQK
jgi:hypothetical protein